MSPKTSTAALGSFGEGRLRNRRRDPRHPAGGRRGSDEVKKQRSNEKAKEEARKFGQAQIVVRQGGRMTDGRANGLARRAFVILPAILRITFSLVLWTLGAKTMTLPEAQMEQQGMSHALPSIEARHEFH